MTARITELQLDYIARWAKEREAERVVDLVAELRRLRAMVDRIYEHVPEHDDELDAEVLEIRQERRAQAVAERARFAPRQ